MDDEIKKWKEMAMALNDEAKDLRAERDEARRELEEWRNSSAHVEADHPDEVHCGCVPVLRKLLTDARRERDEARLLVCRSQFTMTELQHDYAKAKGWDCFKEDGK